MTTHAVGPIVLAAAAGATAGALLGWAYFSLLGRAVQAFIARPSWQRLLAGAGVRMLAAAAALTAVCRLGPAALVAALLGFLLARTRLLSRHDQPRAARPGEER